MPCATLTDNWSGGRDLTLGDITDNRDRAATWTLRYSTEGNKSVSVEARSDNMIDKRATVNVVVDGQLCPVALGGQILQRAAREADGRGIGRVDA